MDNLSLTHSRYNCTYVADIKINVFEIAYLSDEQLNRFHSDFRIVADLFCKVYFYGKKETLEGPLHRQQPHLLS